MLSKTLDQKDALQEHNNCAHLCSLPGQLDVRALSGNHWRVLAILRNPHLRHLLLLHPQPRLLLPVPQSDAQGPVLRHLEVDAEVW